MSGWKFISSLRINFNLYRYSEISSYKRNLILSINKNTYLFATLHQENCPENKVINSVLKNIHCSWETWRIHTNCTTFFDISDVFLFIKTSLKQMADTGGKAWTWRNHCPHTNLPKCCRTSPWTKDDIFALDFKNFHGQTYVRNYNVKFYYFSKVGY